MLLSHPWTRRMARGALLLAVLTGPGCGGEDAAPETLIRPVRVLRVDRMSAEQSRTFPGRAQAGSEAVLSFKVGGQIQKILVEVGDAVSKGDPIAELDDQELRLELRRAEAAHAEASARERSARSTLERTKLLHREQAASDNQLESATTDWESARAVLQAQAQAVALARSEMGYSKLIAPEDGLVASVPVNVNENVNAGEPIATVNFGSLPEVAFAVPGSLIRGVKRGQPVTVRFTSLPGLSFAAEIKEVGVAADRTAYPVTAQLVEADDRIRSGMVAEVSIRVARRAASGGSESIVVPAHAVAEDRGGRFAFVAQPGEGGQGVIERRPVTIGEIGVGGLEVVDGLEPGDLVVTAGIRFVEPGMTVRLVEN